MATSGLPVEYTYTYTAPSPPATVSSTGFVTLLTSGTIQITAQQPGNDNYLPADPVTQPLQINSEDTSAYSISIEGEVYDNPPKEIYYLIDCNGNKDQVEVAFDTEANANVSPAPEFVIETPVPGIYRQEVEITSQDGNRAETYMIIVEKAFPFFDIIDQKFNNVLLVNNNPGSNGGYRFTSYQWFKNGQPIGDGQYYSAGPNETDVLDADAQYQVFMETEAGETLQTCIGSVTLEFDFSISLYPNPNESGRVLNIDIEDYRVSSKNPLHIQLFSLQGGLVKQWRATNNINPVRLPDNIASGVYLVSCQVGSHKRNFKLIIE